MMSDEKHLPKPSGDVVPLSMEELEAGLRMLMESDVDQDSFWDENVAAFRKTVLLAIRETSNDLLSPTITPRWRTELEGQLHLLVRCLELANRRIAVPADASLH